MVLHLEKSALTTYQIIDQKYFENFSKFPKGEYKHLYLDLTMHTLIFPFDREHN